MMNIEIRNATTSFKELAELLKYDNTKTFCLENVNVEGSEDEMYYLFGRLRGHPVIEEFRLVNVTTSQAGLLNVPVGGLVASAPKLRTVHIENSDVNTADVALTISYSSTAKSISGISGEDSVKLATKLVGRAAIAA
jgi:hypothetical protein